MARTVVITKQGIPGSAATGYSPGGTDVAVTDGGTGASSAAAARTNLGLGNVDNTSDANKPVSTAQAAAILAARAYGSVYGPEPTWLYTGPYVYTPNVLTLTANRGYFYRRFTPSVPISKVAFAVTVTTGNICVAAYAHDATANGPGARLATSGSVACPAGPLAEVSLGATVSPEWLYIGSDTGTVVVRSYNAASGAPALVSNGIGCFQTSAFPAPATPAGYSNVSDQRAILVGKP